MAIMVGVGFFFFNKNKNIADYFLGGRQLNVWVASLSAQASDMSGWLLTGLPGLAYLSMAGAKEAIWTAIGLAIGTWLNWMFVAKRLRSYTEISGNSLTLPDYLENRFKDKTRILRLATGCAIVVFFLIYTSSMFVAGAKLFATIFGIQYQLALIIASVIIISYTFLGGFMAVCITDLLQGILMFFAIILVPVLAAMYSGGFEAVATQINPNTFKIFDGADGSITTLVIMSSLVWGLGYFGQPHILARFMAIRKPRDVGPATCIAMVWVVISLAGAVMVGIMGQIYLAQPLGTGQHETVFMAMVNSMFSPILAGVLLSAILAAIMSTADSQLLVTSSVIASDFYTNIIKKNASDKEVLMVSRVSVLGVSIIAVAMAMDPNSSIFSIVSYAWAGLGASFGPAIVLSLYWNRMTQKGAISGVLCGALGTILFKFLKDNVGGIFSVYELLPAFVLAVVVIIVVSLMDKKPSDEILEEFERAKAFAKER